MTERFIPSPSVDSYTRPMDIEIPLIDSDNNTNNLTKPTYSKTVGRLKSNNINSASDSQVKAQKEKDVSLLDKLFPLSQLKHVEFYQALFSEYIGTFILVLVATSAGLPIASAHVPDLNGALASGLIVATIIVCFGHISGAHINPAITVTFVVANEIDLYRALAYIGMQLLGATSASALLRSITPEHARGNLGMTIINKDITLSQAFIVEFLITFVLCYTVLAICDRQRDDIGGSKALAAGFAVTVGCLFGGPFTGAAMNPARAFAPAAIMDSWENHWIYWFGPLTGSIVAALIYTRVLQRTATSAALNRSCLNLNIDRENYI
ncbi:hypothetical protein I4U23_024186 [Adineta vaga]|nr:hypothetical protein I4U23_024186 [Adineta vaga]